jgi:plasmid stabilization system protein ParE
MAKVVWSAHATYQLLSIAEYISRDSVRSAVAVMKRIRKSVRILKRFPQAGRFVPEDDSRVHREVIMPPYRIMYRIVGNECRIKSVLDSRRDVSTLMHELRMFE